MQRRNVRLPGRKATRSISRTYLTRLDLRWNFDRWVRELRSVREFVDQPVPPKGPAREPDMEGRWQDDGGASR